MLLCSMQFVRRRRQPGAPVSELCVSRFSENIAPLIAIMSRNKHCSGGPHLPHIKLCKSARGRHIIKLTENIISQGKLARNRLALQVLR